MQCFNTAKSVNNRHCKAAEQSGENEKFLHLLFFSIYLRIKGMCTQHTGQCSAARWPSPWNLFSLESLLTNWC